MVLKTSLVLVCFIHYCLCTNNAKKEARNPLGVTKFAKKIGESRIINGKNAAMGEFPWQVSLQYKDEGEYHHFCGGSILSERSILTSAFCVDRINEYEDLEVFVMAGVTDLREATDNERYKIRKFWIHKKYNGETLDADIAVIRLHNQITLKPNVTEAVALPPAKGYKIEGKTKAEVTGWGLSEEGESFNPLLQKVELKTVSPRKCKTTYEHYASLSKALICAEGNNKYSCEGDYGGPLVDKDTKVQHGVVSWFVGCSLPESPGVFTKLSHYAGWVSKKI